MRSESCPFCRGNIKRVDSGDLWVMTCDRDVVDQETLSKEDMLRFYLYINSLPKDIPDALFLFYNEYLIWYGMRDRYMYSEIEIKCRPNVDSVWYTFSALYSTSSQLVSDFTMNNVHVVVQWFKVNKKFDICSIQYVVDDLFCILP